MVFRYGIGDILKKKRFAGFGRSHNEGALAFADRGEHVDHTGGDISGERIAGEVEFFFREKWREMLEALTVAQEARIASVDAFDRGERVVLLAFVWRAHSGFHHVAGPESVGFDLLLGDQNVVGRSYIVVVARTQESMTLWFDLKHTDSLN